MAYLCTAQIPLHSIERIQIYMNPGRRKTLADIQKETGADYILNGTLYDMSTGAPVCHLKADGKVYCGPEYNVHGFTWGVPGRFRMALLPNVARDGVGADPNFIACEPLICYGDPEPKECFNASLGGRRGRSAIGVKDNYLTLFCSKDGSAEAKTPAALQEELVSLGWDSAVMLDGGGSSQCAFGEQVITSSRKVAHLILVYLKNPQGGDAMTTIHAYSMAKDGELKLSANFRVKEFACSDGSDPVFVAPALVDLLQKVRDHFGAAVNLTSGYRSAAYNASVKNASKFSQHQYGMAADFWIKGVSPEQVAAYLETLIPNTGGIGVYDGFTHVDVREIKSRWKG